MASFGENLRRERELRGISLREIADASRIGIRFLQAIEEDRYDRLPGGIFPRAFIRQYATHLGLDPDRVVADFVFAQEVESAKPPVAPPPPPPARFPRACLIAASIALGVLGLGLIVFSVFKPRSTQVIVQQPIVVPMPGTPAGLSVYSAMQPTRDGLVLTLSAQQECWVQARVDGNTVLNQVLEEGETKTIEARGEIVLSVGNAGGISFSVNDRPGISLGRAGEVRRNIVITRESLPLLIDVKPTTGNS
ncbi:MAG: DUF4115 domain-containing protein [Vicinamibacteria bacterium]|jgi:cytoskeletal protein RodZ|nr:DUF4115 domain-containing protein [Vicinamibacteria bacterium]